MKTVRSATLVVLVIFTCESFASKVNDRPIIGVLTQESSEEHLKYGQSFFPSSYVDYLQMAGAQVVPVMIFQNENYYENLMKNINGVLFPGGGVNLLSSGYARAAQQIFKLAKQANDAGDYFPLWGTCLGHQLMTALVSGKVLLSSTDGEDYIIPLNLTSYAKESRMLGNAPDDVVKIVTSWNVTSNFHHWGITPENFTKNADLRNFFKVISTNVDRRGKIFISTMEGYKYPFYSTQWHPETNTFRWDIRKHVNHSAGAVRIAQYFADFFVSEARKSSHHFPDVESEAKELIYNYKPVFLGLPSYDVDYYFNYSDVSEGSPDSYLNRAVKACAYNARYLHGLALVWFIIVVPIILCLLCGSSKQRVTDPQSLQEVHSQNTAEKIVHAFDKQTLTSDIIYIHPTNEMKIRLLD